VIVNVLEEECRKLNEVFFYYIANKRPFVVMKYAMTMDGKIATVSGKSKWITSEKTREHSHRFRNKYSAIMVGINTVIEDNPMLNCRLPNTRNPIRIILDSSLKISLDSNICKTSKDIKTFIATVSGDDKKIKELEGLGVEIIKTESDNGRVSLKELMKILGEEKNIDSVYVEGGASLHASLLKEKLVNKALVYIAPKIFGGFEAKSPIGGEGIDEPDNAIRLVGNSITKIEDDLFLEYYLKY
ncbi:bifunctional diaminohydroxyphosphoribosylaminopyrimidine deaminase/5-amino-6-(5-phosphoribosylamino)uracil reductase RibD, partial [Brachyspira pilosicoli]